MVYFFYKNYNTTIYVKERFYVCRDKTDAIFFSLFPLTSREFDS